MGISLMFIDNMDALVFMANKSTTQIDMNCVQMYILSLPTQKCIPGASFIRQVHSFAHPTWHLMDKNRTINTESIATTVLQAESTHLDALT